MALCSNGIMSIDRLDPVNPDLNVVADCTDSIFVPLTIFECRLSFRLILKWHQPASPTFIVKTTRPLSFRSIHFCLIAPQTVLSVVAAELDAAVSTDWHVDFQFEIKVTICTFRDEKVLGTSSQHKFSILDRNFTPIKRIDPSSGGLAIEQFSRFGVGLCSEYCQTNQNAGYR